MVVQISVSPTRATIPATGIVAGYTRLTRQESLDKNLSAPAQRREIETYARDASLGNVVFFEEHDPVGGDVAFEERAAGRQLLEAIAAGQVAHVIVRDIDRLVRSDRIWLAFRDALLKHGVTLHTVTGGPVPLASPSDRLASGVKVLAAQYEKEQTAERGRRAKREAARQGRHVGGPPPFGFTSQSRYCRALLDQGVEEAAARAKAEKRFPHRATLFTDPSEAKIVKTIFHLYVRRQMGCRAICRWLNERGHRRRSGKLWHPDKVSRVLSDPSVAGFVAYDEARFEKRHLPATPKAKQHLFKGQHKAIIGEQLWRKAQEVREANKNPLTGLGNAGPHNRRYALSGVLLCSCGSPMTIASQQKTRGYAYLACRRRRDYGPDAPGGCNRPRVPVGKVDEAVWAAISEMITTPPVVEAVHKAAWRALQDHRRLQQPDGHAAEQFAKVKKDLIVWYDRHDAAGNKIEQDAAWRRILELSAKQQELEPLVEAEQAGNSTTLPTVTREAVEQFLVNLAKLMPESEDRGVSIIRSLVADHQLTVRLQDDGQLAISMAIRPFGSVFRGSEHVVPVERTVRLPKGDVDAWLDAHMGQHVCEICGEQITVTRSHFWRGIPRAHRDCHVRELGKRRRNGDPRYYSGMQAAERLGVGRSTITRYMERGVIAPAERQGKVLLFDRAAIDALADRKA